jgi:uncharacterized UBP type Zn finger protein
MTQYEHPSIALAERYGSDAAFVASHGHEPRSVDDCDECHEQIFEGETVYHIGERTYCETCVTCGETIAEYDPPDEPDWYKIDQDRALDGRDPADEPGFED